MASYDGPAQTIIGQVIICPECGNPICLSAGKAWSDKDNAPIEFHNMLSCPTMGCKGNVAERLEQAVEAETQWRTFMESLWRS